jgi:ribosomal protein S15P/S13E
MQNNNAVMDLVKIYKDKDQTIKSDDLKFISQVHKNVKNHLKNHKKIQTEFKSFTINNN